MNKFCGLGRKSKQIYHLICCLFGFQTDFFKSFKKLIFLLDPQKIFKCSKDT